MSLIAQLLPDCSVGQSSAYAGLLRGNTPLRLTLATIHRQELFQVVNNRSTELLNIRHRIFSSWDDTKRALYSFYAGHFTLVFRASRLFLLT